MDFPGCVNDHGSTPEQRLTALSDFLARDSGRIGRSGESNNHIHTCYSFSPYTPSAAAFQAWRAGLAAAGSVDHDSLAGAPEMRKACSMLGLGSVTGFELRVFLYDADRRVRGLAAAPLSSKKINNPDSTGIIYMTVQGVPQAAASRVEKFLRPVRKARRDRTEIMCRRASNILESIEARALDFERDVAGHSHYASGGTITERHLLAAMADSLIETFRDGQKLSKVLESGLDLKLSASVKASLCDAGNIHRTYDLLGILKSQLLPGFFIQPSDEILDAKDVVAFALSIGAIPAYAYLGDVVDSPTGDKRSEKFEDDFLEELFDELRSMGFPAVTYMPPRNSPAQLARVGEMCHQWGFMEISGVDINQPSQSFNCPELLKPEFSRLDESTWAMVAHETLSDFDVDLGLFAPGNPFASRSLGDRIRLYAKAGHDLVVGAVVTVAETLRKGRYG